MTQDYRPMIGLNVYLEPQFRKEVVEKVYANLPALSDDIRRNLIQLTKEDLKVPGFRNPMLAPRALLVKTAVDKFEKDSRFVRQILKSWASLYADYQELVLESLNTLGFSVLKTATAYEDPESAFDIGWPEDLNYEKLQEVLTKNPKNTLNSDENALLTIYLTGFLP